MIVARLIDRVEVNRGYKVHIRFKISVEQFLGRAREARSYSRRTRGYPDRHAIFDVISLFAEKDIKINAKTPTGTPFTSTA